MGAYCQSKNEIVKRIFLLASFSNEGRETRGWEASPLSPLFLSGGHKKDKRNGKQEPHCKREEDRPEAMSGTGA